MQKLIAFSFLLIGCSMALSAGPAAAPEISPASGTSAIALLAGGWIILRSRKK